MRRLQNRLAALVCALVSACAGESIAPNAGESPVPRDSIARIAAVTSTGLPARVLDLAAGSATDASIKLTFTHVDDGTGLPASYDIRYALNAINWGSAQSVVAGSCPLPAGPAIGTSVTCTVSGLSAVSTYQFQLVAFRGTLNVNATFGPLSTIATATTMASVAAIAISPSSTTDSVGRTRQFRATLTGAAGVTLNGYPVRWTSSDPTVMAVDTTGLAMARGAGNATITASAGGKTASATAAVVATAPGTVSNLAIAGQTDSSIVISFTEVAGGAGMPASYEVRIAPSALTWWLAPPVSRGSCATPVAGVTVGATRSCTILGLTPETAYQLQLVTYRGTLNQNAVFGGLSNVVGTTTAQVPVASVTVAPTSLTVTLGATAQLAATVKDASGQTLTGRPTTWTSSQSSIATVDALGLVRALAAGTASITATSGGKSGSAVVTIPAPSASAAECSSPGSGWIWCDDFEQDRLNQYFEYDNAGGRFVRLASTGYQGSTGMRASWNAGSQGAGALHLALGRTPSAYIRPVDAGMANYRELYWRMYVKHQAGWVGGGGDKLSRAFIFANGNWAQAAIGHVWSGTSETTAGNYLKVDPSSGTDASGNLLTTGYNDFAHMRWLGAVQGATPVFDAAHVGQWYCVEARLRLNDAGQPNGVQELWINGQLEAQRTGLNLVGSYSAYGINAVYFENYWNAGSPTAQSRAFDNIVVSTARIGCL